MHARAVLASSLVLALAACSDARSQARPDDAMIEPYIAIATALSKDSTAEVAEAADQVKRGAATLADKPGVARIVGAADALGSSDLAGARRSFKTMSDGMVEYMRSESASQSGRVLIHCPMAFANEGALWVQSEGKIANPYHGSEMLRCGNKLAWDAAELPPTAKLD
jgi:hypothetical protein